ncbi:HalOD1 output domain-containing protein [Halosimplex amylolyticum]|uniref:HalOD1 output domain-containing protein n=1 Tax=Halosimplex amylolyticum TaxID=3396616 RepID=UPI003F57A578
MTEFSHHSDGEWTVRHDPERSIEPCTAIVEAVAAVTGTEPTLLPPLGDTVDGDAVNAILSDAGSSVGLSFAYAGVEVCVEPTGEVLARRVAEGN